MTPIFSDAERLQQANADQLQIPYADAQALDSLFDEHTKNSVEAVT